MSLPRLSIVAPVYEEAANIEKTIRVLAALVRTPYELVLVHDTETDGTLPVVRRLQPEFPNVRLVLSNVGDGRGVVNALKTGFREAKGELVCVFTADGTDQPDAIDPMIAKIDTGFDVVSGTRYVAGAKKYGGPLLQTWLSRGGNLMLKKLAGFPLSDATYSFKVYRRAVLEKIEIECTEGWVISLEVSIKAYLAGFRLTEIPTVWIDRQLGTSRFQLGSWFGAYAKWLAFGAYEINKRRMGAS